MSLTRRRRLVIAFITTALALLSIVWPSGAPAPGQAFRQGQQLLALERAISEYHRRFEEYPPSAAWFHALTQAGLISANEFTLTLEDVPTDIYGRAYTYEPPGESNAEFVAAPRLRSVGLDGIDNHGLKDDWDLRFGPRPPHWYYRRWIKGGVVAALVLLLAVAYASYARSRFLRSTIIVLGFGLSLVLGPVIADPMWRFSTSPAPKWWSVLFGTGLTMVFGACVIMVSRLLMRTAPEHACRRCGYDLSQCTRAGCPECGHGRDDAGPRSC